MTTLAELAVIPAGSPPKTPLALWQKLRLRIARIAAAEASAKAEQASEAEMLMALDLANEELDAAVEELCSLEAEGVLADIEHFLSICERHALVVGGAS